MSNILKGIVNEAHYPEDPDEYEAMFGARRKPKRMEPDEPQEPYNPWDEHYRRQDAAQAKYNKEVKVEYSDKEGVAPNGERYNSAFVVRASNPYQGDNEIRKFEDLHWGAKKIVDTVKKEPSNEGEPYITVVYYVDNHKYGTWRPWKDEAPTQKPLTFENPVEQFGKVLEGISQEDLANVLCHRIEMRYPDIYKKYDYDAMYNAVDDVASFHAGAEELGSSDISMMIRQVFKRLEESEGLDEGIARGPKEKKLFELLEAWGYFISLKTSKIANDAIDNNASQELRAMQRHYLGPVMNGMSFVDITKSDLWQNPKAIPHLLKYIYQGIPYIEERIKKFVNPASQPSYLSGVEKIKQLYKEVVAQYSQGQQGVTEGSSSKLSSPFEGGKKTTSITPKHKPLVWENMLGTVMAKDPTLKAEPKYFDYKWDDARAYAKVDQCDDLRICKSPGLYQGWPEKGKMALWGIPRQGVAEGLEDKTAQQRKTERDKQRTAPAQKARNAAQRKGLTQDKDGTYYAKEGVAEEKGTLWRVHQSEATGRYHVVKGYNKDIKMYKNKMGAGDFNSKASAQAKADELNKGIEEGWKQNLAAAGAAGLMALGGGGAHAGGVTLGGGGHTVDNQIRMNQQMTQQVQQQAPKRDLSGFATEYLQKAADPNRFGRFLVSPEEAKAELAARESGTSSYKEPQKPAPSANNGFSKEYLEKAADPNRFGRYLISIEKAQELLKQMNATNEDQLDELKCWDGYKRVPGTKAGAPGSCEEINEIFNPTSGISSFLRSASNFISDYVPVLLGVGGTFVATSAVLGPVAAALASSTVGTQIFQTLQNQQNKVPGMIQQMIEKYVGSEQEAKEFMLLHAKTAYLEKPEFRWRGQNWPVTLKKDQAEAIVEKFDKSWLEQHLAKEKESGELNEYSTDRLAKYKTAAAADARAADKAGDFARGNKRFAGIVKATKKQFDNETKPKKESAIMKGLVDENLGTPYPGTYEQEFGPFKRKGQERTMKIAFEGKKNVSRRT